MKWYEREYTFKNQPYPAFLGDVIWSAIVVLLVATMLLEVEVAMPVIAAACSITTLLLGRMIVHRRSEHRARMGLVPRRGLGLTPLSRGRPAMGS